MTKRGQISKFTTRAGGAIYKLYFGHFTYPDFGYDNEGLRYAFVDYTIGKTLSHPREELALLLKQVRAERNKLRYREPEGLGFWYAGRTDRRTAQ